MKYTIGNSKPRNYIMKNLNVSTEKVVNTKAFKDLSKVMQLIVKKYNNIKKIENGVNIVSYKGYERFEREHNFSWANKLIVKELTKN